MSVLFVANIKIVNSFFFRSSGGALIDFDNDTALMIMCSNDNKIIYNNNLNHIWG